MHMDDDDRLAAAMRAIDPARTPERTELTPAQIAIRDRITATGNTRAVRRRPVLWLTTALPAAAVLVVALIVVFTFAPVRPAAATLKPLEFTNTGQTNQEVLDMARAALEKTRTGPAEAERSSVSLGWYAHIDNPGAPGQRVAISPEITTYRWDADQSGRITVVAAKPYWSDGSAGAIPSDDALPAGTVISDTTFTAGSPGASLNAPPPDSPDGLLSWMEGTGLTADADGADLIDAIQAAFSLWTLSDAQHAALLELLLARDDVTVLGDTEDRIGRDVVGVAADSARFPGVRKILLISAETGRIVGVESFRTTAGENLPSGFVLNYILWGPPLS